MILKRVLCAFSAAAIAASMSVSAFADASEEKEVIEFKADESMLTSDDSAPTISFDTSDWEKYVHLSPDAELIGLKIKQDADTYYQGASLKVFSDSAGYTEKPYNYADTLRDADNNLIHPDYNENTVYVTPGVELRAEDFGLTCFDGCLITYNYRIGTDVQNKLMDNSVYVFPVDGEYTHQLSMPIKLQYNDSDSDNVSQYRSQMVNVPGNVSATRIVFEIPITAKMDADIFYLDNISIQTPLEDSDGNTLYVKNLDNYNANAKPRATIEGIKIKKQGNNISQTDSTSKESKSSFNPVIIVVGVLIAGVIALVVVMIIKHKNKYY